MNPIFKVYSKSEPREVIIPHTKEDLESFMSNEEPLDYRLEWTSDTEFTIHQRDPHCFNWRDDQKGALGDYVTRFNPDGIRRTWYNVLPATYDFEANFIIEKAVSL